MASPTLAGLRVLLTRPQCDGADDWAAALSAAGASPIFYPTVAIVPPESWQPLDDALANLSGYDWMVLTSQTAVAYMLGRLPGARFPDNMRPRIAAVGPKTAEAIVERGGQVALVPEDNRQEGLAQALAGQAPGTRVLFPLASGGRTLLAERLRAQGCIVNVVTAYATAPVPNLPEPPPFEVATFASPSALRAFLAQIGPAALQDKTLAVIGPTTAKEATAYGLSPIVAQKPDIGALIFAIAQARQTLGDPHVIP